MEFYSEVNLNVKTTIGGPLKIQYYLCIHLIGLFKLTLSRLNWVNWLLTCRILSNWYKRLEHQMAYSEPNYFMFSSCILHENSSMHFTFELWSRPGSNIFSLTQKAKLHCVYFWQGIKGFSRIIPDVFSCVTRFWSFVLVSGGHV